MPVLIPSLPKLISVACIDKSRLSECQISQEELALLSTHAVEKRRVEFILGREAARRALKALGKSETSIVGKGQNREPIWPADIVGSITHAGDHAIAAVAWSKDYQSIGIDLEESNRGQNIAKAVATGKEFEWINAETDLIQERSLAIFSAKESIYKALYPLCEKFLEFKDAELEAHGQKFKVQLSEKALKYFPNGIGPIEVEWQRIKDKSGKEYLFTAVLI